MTTQNVQYANRVANYLDLTQVSGKAYNKSWELMKCTNSDSALKSPFYFLAGLVTLVASAALAAIEVPVKLAYNVFAGVLNTVANLLYGRVEVVVAPRTMKQAVIDLAGKGLQQAKNGFNGTVDFVSDHRKAVATTAVAATGLVATAYFGIPAGLATLFGVAAEAAVVV